MSDKVRCEKISKQIQNGTFSDKINFTFLIERVQFQNYTEQKSTDTIYAVVIPRVQIWWS